MVLWKDKKRKEWESSSLISFGSKDDVFVNQTEIFFQMLSKGMYRKINLISFDFNPDILHIAYNSFHTYIVIVLNNPTKRCHSNKQ